MDRRKALKNIGLSLGYMVATPSVISLLQSCKNDTEKNVLWKPEFFSTEEGNVLKNLVDLILPKTENLPGAIELNIHKFLDQYFTKVYDEKKQKETKSGIEAISKGLKKPISSLKTEDYDHFLTKYLRATKEDKEKFSENDTIIFDTLSGLRDITVWAYKTTEEIGENVLAYDPIPGIQKGCVSLEETTGGMSWSL